MWIVGIFLPIWDCAIGVRSILIRAVIRRTGNQKNMSFKKKKKHLERKESGAIHTDIKGSDQTKKLFGAKVQP